MAFMITLHILILFCVIRGYDRDKRRMKIPRPADFYQQSVWDNGEGCFTKTIV